jgi:hypothetical protein
VIQATGYKKLLGLTRCKRNGSIDLELGRDSSNEGVLIRLTKYWKHMILGELLINVYNPRQMKRKRITG